MTQLANANLLDESVANSSSLKDKRLSKTAQTASNPNPNPNPSPLKKVDMEVDNDNDNDFEVNDRADNFQKFQNEYMNQSNSNETEKKSDGKILGMPKGVAIGLGVLVLGAAAYFGYKYFKKNKSKGLSSGTSTGSSVESATSTIIKT